MNLTPSSSTDAGRRTLDGATGSDRREELLKSMELMTEAIRQAAKGLFELHASLYGPTPQNQKGARLCADKDGLDGLQSSQGTPQET